MNSSSSEMKPRSPVRSQGRSGEAEQDALQRLGVVKNDVTSAISNSPGLDVADLAVVQPGSIPTTTSGKIRRSASVEHYRGEQFIRLDA
jgi:acyl-CoA synthetase (AMP-forming)/AMP-acid ligase II